MLFITHLKLANRILMLTNSRSEIIYRPVFTKENLGWSTEVSLEGVLRENIAYFDALLPDSY